VDVSDAVPIVETKRDEGKSRAGDRGYGTATDFLIFGGHIVLLKVVELSAMKCKSAHISSVEKTFTKSHFRREDVIKMVLREVDCEDDSSGSCPMTCLGICDLESTNSAY
jgi:hypothetical protein